MEYRVFVYGTLMKGRSNHHYLKDSTYLYDAVLDDYILYDTGFHYPAAVPMKGNSIIGEVYVIDEKTRQECDELEEEGILYACKKVTVLSGDLKEEVLFYEYIEDVSSMKLYTQEGKWQDQ